MRRAVRRGAARRGAAGGYLCFALFMLSLSRISPEAGRGGEGPGWERLDRCDVVGQSAMSNRLETKWIYALGRPM